MNPQYPGNQQQRPVQQYGAPPGHPAQQQPQTFNPYTQPPQPYVQQQPPPQQHAQGTQNTYGSQNYGPLPPGFSFAPPQSAAPPSTSQAPGFAPLPPPTQPQYHPTQYVSPPPPPQNIPQPSAGHNNAHSSSGSSTLRAPTAIAGAQPLPLTSSGPPQIGQQAPPAPSPYGHGTGPVTYENPRMTPQAPAAYKPQAAPFMPAPPPTSGPNMQTGTTTGPYGFDLANRMQNLSLQQPPAPRMPPPVSGNPLQSTIPQGSFSATSNQPIPQPKQNTYAAGNNNNVPQEFQSKPLAKATTLPNQSTLAAQSQLQRQERPIQLQPCLPNINKTRQGPGSADNSITPASWLYKSRASAPPPMLNPLLQQPFFTAPLAPDQVQNYLLNEENSPYSVKVNDKGVITEYPIIRLLGQGGEGTSFVIKNKRTGLQTAAKVSKRVDRLREEYYNGYGRLRGMPRVPSAHAFYDRATCNHPNFEGDKNVGVLFIDLFGDSLSSVRRHQKHRQVSVKAVAHVGKQIFKVLRTLHLEYNCLHCDIKDDNILLGGSKDKNQIFLIDFGMLKKYRWKHQFNPNTYVYIPEHPSRRGFCGTSVYSAPGPQLGTEWCRRDECWTALNMLCRMLLGRLPWDDDVKRPDPKLPGPERVRLNYENHDFVANKKLNCTVNDLFGPPLFNEDPDRSFLRDTFAQAYDHVRSLGYEDQPNYQFLIGLFTALWDRFPAFNQYPTYFDWSPLFFYNMPMVKEYDALPETPAANFDVGSQQQNNYFGVD